MKNYLKIKFKIILLIVLLFLIVFIIFSLYNTNLEPILYAYLLCFIILFILSIFDYTNYKNNLEAFKLLKDKIYFTDDDFFKTNSLYEKQYQNLLLNLSKYIKDKEYEYDSKYIDMLDYYTIWAHQIKIPVQALKLLTDGKDEKEQLFKIEQYINMVMQYLRVDVISNDLSFVKFNLDDIVKQNIRKYKDLFIKSNLTLKYTQIDLKIISDKKWLSFVIEQILSNSLKYTKKGYISIYLNENNELVIQDSGIGINDEDLLRIFEKGYTGYNGRYYLKSSGIGLYLCGKIVKKLNHTIKIQSKKGFGTSVIINFNLTKM